MNNLDENQKVGEGENIEKANGENENQNKERVNSEEANEQFGAFRKKRGSFSNIWDMLKKKPKKKNEESNLY